MKHTYEKSIIQSVVTHMVEVIFIRQIKISRIPYPPYLRVHEPLLTFSSLPLKVLRHLLQLPPNLRRETLLYPQAHPGKQLFIIEKNAQLEQTFDK